jgi:hypothetical protein
MKQIKTFFKLFIKVILKILIFLKTFLNILVPCVFFFDYNINNFFSCLLENENNVDIDTNNNEEEVDYQQLIKDMAYITCYVVLIFIMLKYKTLDIDFYDSYLHDPYETYEQKINMPDIYASTSSDILKPEDELAQDTKSKK